MPLVNTGSHVFRVGNCPTDVAQSVATIYGDAFIEDGSLPADFQVSLRFDSWLRRLIKPQITFHADCRTPFKPAALTQAFPILEWGMNWCVASFDFNRLNIHSAVLVKDGKAIIFPAAPGSGKSTLTAYLAMTGWDLYSDEMALIEFESNLVSPMYRPISLKNQSIDLVKTWFPDAVMSPVAKNTQKGDVAHLKAIDWARHSQLNSAEIVGVVFPQYQADSDLTIYSMNKMQGFEQICSNAFNYNVVAERGFDTVTAVIEASRQFEVHYSRVEELAEFLLEEIIEA